ncbi:MAG TPA: xanthine dehydrogenase family protein molybdopterin-binding subunit, partial [Acidimicrobiales bacterium]|nr:xanthine dehydrogenase family protein molybdopterin-binding subunit [Acidimicrobiales bacterium]
VMRTEDPKFLTVGGRYLDDLEIPGAAYVTYVRSTMAHARLTAVDAGEAAGAPGVVAVFTGADVDLEPLAPAIVMLNQAVRTPFLARDTVRYVGEPIVAIVSETRAQGMDAAELVFVDYEPLPAVVDMEAALTDETVLHAEAGTNLILDMQFGRSDDLFDGCDVVVTQRILNQRVAPCPMEVRAAAATWEDGRLVHYACTQMPHGVKETLCQVYGLEPAQVRVVAPDVGGGFGAKGANYTEELMVGWLSKQVGRPVRWVETRSESMVGLGHGRGQIQDAELGGTRDGKVLAYRLTVIQDSGAYGWFGGVLPFMTRTMLSGVYDIPKAEFNSQSVMTNTTPTVAYRGAGRPEATAAIERMMEMYAAEIGMDPAEVRRKNLVTSDRFPFTTVVGTEYDAGNYERALELVLEASDYAGLRAEQQRRRDAGGPKQLGIGGSIYVEITNYGGSGEFGSLEVLPDGSAEVRTGTSPHGQGHETAWAMLASEQTGIPIDRIKVVHGDTDLVPTGGGTAGSRSAQAGGVAVHQAAVQVVDKAKQLAADLLEANPDDLVLDKVDGRFHVAGTPSAGKSWSELAAAAGSAGDGGDTGLKAMVDFKPPTATFPFGAHICVAEVDTETGKVTVERLIAVDDAGTIINPLLADGQIHGGLAQGVAQALLEEVRYDDDGNPVTANLADYAFISAAELPSFETVRMETPTPVNELGVKGIGESGTVGSTPAVQNAVVDALAHLGVRHVDMPATPERVWRAIADASA